MDFENVYDGTDRKVLKRRPDSQMRIGPVVD
jgi:hypothetical protein